MNSPEKKLTGSGGINARIRILLFGVGRDSVVFRNILSSLMARGFSIMSTLVMIPIILHRFGIEKYGAWVIAVSLSSIFSLADFGVVNAMLSYFSKAFGQADRPTMRRLLSSTLCMSILASFGLVAVALIATKCVDWMWVLGVEDPALARQASWIIFLTALGIAVQFPLAAIRHARLGMLQGVPVNLWDLVGSLLATAALIFSAWRFQRLSVRLYSCLVTRARLNFHAPTQTGQPPKCCWRLGAYSPSRASAKR
jgi:O-antigen/teichoic acid export membrane protein